MPSSRVVGKKTRQHKARFSNVPLQLMYLLSCVTFCQSWMSPSTLALKLAAPMRSRGISYGGNRQKIRAESTSMRAFPFVRSMQTIQQITPTPTPSLQPAQLLSSLSTIIFTAIVLKVLGLKSQSSRIVIAAARMSVQLLFVGMFVLTPLFAFASTSPWKIAAWISLVAILASREASSRSKYEYKGQMLDCFLAMFGGVGLTLLHLVQFVLRSPMSATPIQVSWNAQTIIPIAGMLFGNSLSATSLGMSILQSNFLESGRERVELRLARGANVWEAALPVVREALEAALLPTVNAMAATGIIFMPGMMTGQILGGQSPSAAAAYQIMIYFAIGASSCLTAMSLACIVTARMFDLHEMALVPRRNIPGLRSVEKNGIPKQRKNIFDLKRSRQQTMAGEVNKNRIEHVSKVYTLSNEKSAVPRFEGITCEQSQPLVSSIKDNETLLSIRDLTVESTNLTVPLIDVYDGDRIGITGVSGIGKTQLLRKIAKLDPLPQNEKRAAKLKDQPWLQQAISLRGQSWLYAAPAYWRSQVMWVSQDRTTLPGTPREFYEEVICYRSHRNNENSKHGQHTHESKLHSSSSPMIIAQQWNLSVTTWDQQWSELSGGEAQRASLAIALSLEPAILLLDEPTSSCDKDTTLRIETTLREKGVSIIIVSHSDEQVQRFCSSKIVLWR